VVDIELTGSYAIEVSVCFWKDKCCYRSHCLLWNLLVDKERLWLLNDIRNAIEVIHFCGKAMVDIEMTCC
jgi:hypothetical protein